MAISTTAFGIYFYLMSRVHNPASLNLMMQQTSEEPHVDLAWLALASMAVFISGESPNYKSKFVLISQIKYCKSQTRMIKSIYESYYEILSILKNKPFCQKI